MVRKDSEKDSDRPHYYSQFWLDIAAGRKTIGVSRSDEADIVEPELDEPVPTRRAGRNSAASHRYEAPIVHPTIEPEEEEEEIYEEEQPDEMDMAEDEIDEADIPDVLVDETEAAPELEDEVAPVADLPPDEVEEEEIAPPIEEEEEDFFDDEEEEEEDWPGRGRKKPKGRQTRLPTSKKPRRERRPGF